MLAVACVTGAPAGVTCGAVRPAVLRPLGPYLYGSKAVAIFPATTTRCAVKRRRHALRRQAGMRSNAASTSDSQGGTAHELSEGSAPDFNSLTVSEAPVAATEGLRSSQTASLSQSLIAASPRMVAREIGVVMSGPGSVLLAVIMAVMGALSAVRSFLRNRMRNCSTCKSYGLVRCVLCDGSGIISWEGKFLHEDLCPSCMGKRYCSCPECGGMFKHRLFKHRRPIPVELMQSMDEAEVTVAATQNRTGGPRVQLD